MPPPPRVSVYPKRGHKYLLGTCKIFVVSKRNSFSPEAITGSRQKIKCHWSCVWGCLEQWRRQQRWWKTLDSTPFLFRFQLHSITRSSCLYVSLCVSTSTAVLFYGCFHKKKQFMSKCYIIMYNNNMAHDPYYWVVILHKKTIAFASVSKNSVKY